MSGRVRADPAPEFRRPLSDRTDEPKTVKLQPTERTLFPLSLSLGTVSSAASTPQGTKTTSTLSVSHFLLFIQLPFFLLCTLSRSALYPPKEFSCPVLWHYKWVREPNSMKGFHDSRRDDGCRRRRYYLNFDTMSVCRGGSAPITKDFVILINKLRIKRFIELYVEQIRTVSNLIITFYKLGG